VRDTARSPESTPAPLISATATPFEASRPIVTIGTMEYCLGKDGDVLHRAVGNVTFLDARHPFWGRLTDDEKLALEMLRTPTQDAKMRPQHAITFRNVELHVGNHGLYGPAAIGTVNEHDGITEMLSLIVIDHLRGLGFGTEVIVAAGERWPTMSWDATNESLGFHQSLVRQGIATEVGTNGLKFRFRPIPKPKMIFIGKPKRFQPGRTPGEREASIITIWIYIILKLEHS
jgi:hypothetical protein